MDRLPLYILSGGQSSRFGSDKARAMLGELPLISSVAESMAPIFSDIWVVAAAQDAYADLGLATIADVQPSLGPMGGLYTALLHHKRQGIFAEYATPNEPSDSPWCALVSCDMAGLRAEWFASLWEVACKGEALAVAFGPEPWDPLFALYHVDLLPHIEARIASGSRSLWRLLEAVEARALPHPAGWEGVTSINTPEALQAHLLKVPAS